MRKTYTNDEKSSYINQYLSGISITDISKSSGISRSTVYNWIKLYTETSKNKNPVNMRDYNLLKQKCERQENIISILKTSGCTVFSPLHDRFEVIKSMSDKYNINTLCEALNVAKGSYYNHILRNKNENTLAAKRRAELTPVIEEIFNNSRQTFGAGKITAIMNDSGHHTSERTVAKIMHENGWFSIKSSAKKLYLQFKERKENILNQQFNPQHPNEVWVNDVTYFKFNQKTFYICVILDLFARKAISCNVSLKNSTWLTKSALKHAIETRNPDTSKLLFHSDQGFNFTSKTFMSYLMQSGIKQSFSRKGIPYDNSVCESFFNSMKRAELYRTNYKSERELKECIHKYIEFYNSKRPHSILLNRTPDRVETEYFNKQEQMF